MAAIASPLLGTLKSQIATIDRHLSLYGGYMMEEGLTAPQLHIYTDRYRDLEMSKASLLARVRNLTSQNPKSSGI